MKEHSDSSLSKDERGAQADKLIGYGERGGNRTFMDQLGERIDVHGVQRPEVEVVYKNLTVTTKALVGSASIPTVVSPLVNTVKKLLFMQQTGEGQTLSLVNEVSGVLRPGRLTLLLGPPSSGKSSFMKALSGRLGESDFLETHGNMWFNGQSPSEFQHSRSVAYVAQVDNHEANLSVTETLDFAYLCTTGMGGPTFDLASEIRGTTADVGDREKGVGHAKSAADLTNGNGILATNGTTARDGALPVSSSPSIPRATSKLGTLLRKMSTRKGGVDSGATDGFEEALGQVWSGIAKVDLVMKLLGLYHCRDTLVGNEIHRGISGGEKKRLTTAEQLMGTRSVFMLDEISTGLDSATLFTVIRWLSKWCHSLKTTTVISLLQPPPEVFQGQEIYHGPVQDAVAFFSTLGFECPTRKDVPSYLLELTTAKGQLQYASEQLRAAHNLPLTGDYTKLSRTLNKQQLLVPIEDMRKAFWETCKHGQAMAKELASVPASKSSHPASLVKTAGYPLGVFQSIGVATKRQTILMLRDKVLLKGRLMQVTVISLISASLYYQLPVSITGSRSYLGLCFLMVLFINFGGMPQLPLTIDAKKVWFKHRANGFMPAYAQGLAMSLAQIPLSLIEGVVFSLIMYFLVGLYQDAGYFFTFFLITITNSITATALFRLLGCLSPNLVKANAAGGLMLLILIVSSGFVILRQEIPPWMIWAYWISPFAWGVRAFAINELTSPRWNEEPYPDNPSVTLGHGALTSFGLYTERYWIWADIGFQLGLFILLTLGAIVSLWVLNPEQMPASLPDEDAVAAARAAAEEHRQQIAAHREAALNGGHSQGTALGNGVNGVSKASLGTNFTPADTNKGKGSEGSGDGAGAGDADGVSSPTEKDKKVVKVASRQHVAVDIDIASSLEFQPITLVFKDIGYSVPNPSYDRKAAKEAAKVAQSASRASSLELQTGDGKAPTSSMATVGVSGSGVAPVNIATQERLKLLTDITGYVEPGVLIALMGGSGAGKTTLMDVLAGRKTVGEITGDIFVNGHPKQQKTWSRVVGYCEQNDIHTPLQTVRDALLFSARLRLPPSISDEKVRAYVEEVMDIVDLMDIMYNLVGQPGVTGLSVEQRKRLTIAVELVANPSVVFMDEPTSGLDARAAAIVMQAVRNVARNGRTVMVTIHQPSIEIFEAFDKLLLIQRGGRTTYFGPVGEHSVALISYLKAVPGTPDLIPGYNPATWMLEVTGGSMATLVEPVDADWPALYAASALAAEAREHADYLIADSQKQGLPTLQLSSEYAQPFTVQTMTLLRKFAWSYWHNPAHNLIRFVLTLISAFIYGAMFWKQGQIPSPTANIANIQSVVGIMYSSTNFMGLINLMSGMAVVAYERVVFYRERGASMYNPFAYGIAMSLVELPYLLGQGIIFLPIIYWMVDFEHTADQFFMYFIMYLETITFFSTFAQFLVYITPNQGIAQVLGASLNFLFNIFCGFVITYPDIPKGWRWLNRISPITWIIYGLAVNQTDRSDITIVFNTQTLTVKEFMEARFGYYSYMRWWTCLIVLAYIIFLRVTSVLALRYWNFLKR